jgi:DNA-binding NarL/FixJ family response regulator
VTAPATDGDAAAPSLRVVVSDARPVVRAGLCAAIEPVADVTDVPLEHAVARVLADGPDVLVTGLRIDDVETFKVVAGANAGLPALKVLIVADGATVIDLREAVIAGVDSFVLASSPVGEVRDATVRTAKGERIISPSIAMQLAGTWRQDPREAGASALTPRELEVLQLLAEGLTNERIGERIGLTSRTVKTHVQNLLVKLDVPDRTGAVARGFRLGLIR